MTQPLPYERDFDFEDFQSSHPSTPLPGDKVNVEFDQVAATIDAVRARIADLQRDDREVHNKVIGFDQLKDELRKGFTTPTVWAAGTRYEIGASVYVGRKVYAALVAHTSGANFNADNLTGKWYLLADFTAVTNVDQAAADAALAAKQSATSAAGSANAAQNSEVSAGVSETNAAASASEAAATLAGTVKGPVSSTTDNIALFSDTTGKLLKDSGKKISDFGTGDMLAANDLSDLSSTPTARANLVVGTFVADLTALGALDATKDTLAYLKEAGREGQFVWKAGDFSAQVTADTTEAIFIKATAVAATSGAWVRANWNALDTRWFGGSASNTAAQNKTALQAAIAVCDALGGGEILNPWVVDYGYAPLDQTTYPDFTGVVHDMRITDFSNSVDGYPAAGAKQGWQSKIWHHTPQTTPAGQHDGNGFRLSGDWHPYFWASSEGNYIPYDGGAGGRTADYNYRASYFLGQGGAAKWQMCQGVTQQGNLPDDELLDFAIIGWKDDAGIYYPLVVDYTNGAAVYGLGTSAPQAAHHFHTPDTVTGMADIKFSTTGTSITHIWQLGTSYDTSRDIQVVFDANGWRIFFPDSGIALQIDRASRATTFGGPITAPVIKATAHTMGETPDAAVMGAGAMIYRSDLAKPIWSDGTVWRDAAGTAV